MLLDYDKEPNDWLNKKQKLEVPKNYQTRAKYHRKISREKKTLTTRVPASTLNPRSDGCSGNLAFNQNHRLEKRAKNHGCGDQ